MMMIAPVANVQLLPAFYNPQSPPGRRFKKMLKIPSTLLRAIVLSEARFSPLASGKHRPLSPNSLSGTQLLSLESVSGVCWECWDTTKHMYIRVRF